MGLIIYLAYFMFLVSLIFAFCKKSFTPLTFCSYSLGVVVYVQLVQIIFEMGYILSGFHNLKPEEMIEYGEAVFSGVTGLVLIALLVAVVPMTMIAWWYVKRFESFVNQSDILKFNMAVFAVSVLADLGFASIPPIFKTTSAYILSRSALLLLIVMIAGAILNLIAKRINN